MEAKGYEIKNAEFGENSRKYITFRSPDMSRPVRGSAKSLGKNFTKERIKERINNKLRRTRCLHIIYIIFQNLKTA